MLNQLIEILRASGADAWEVTDERKTGWEFYFIRHKLDQNRFTDVEEYTVKVYRKIDDGKFLGSAQASVSTTASADEIRRVVAGLCQDALYVRNPAYTLNRPVFQPPVPETPVDIKAISRDFLNTLASLPETATEDLNSYEIFVSEVRTRFLNSEGIDVTSVSPSSVVEAVVNARRDGHEIELYRFYRSGACDAEQLTHDLSETLRYGRDKLIAGETPALGTADVVLSTDAATSVYEYFISRLSTAAVYRRISNWEIGKPVAEQFTGDKVTVRALRELPNSSSNGAYDREGAPVRDLLLMDAGVPVHFFGSRQFSQYLGLENSFIPNNYEVTGGTLSADELRQGAFLEVVEFSDFQVNVINGGIAGEIRLAYWHDGTGKVTPVSGGSVSGSISELMSTMRFSRESRQYNNMRIPAVTRLNGATVTGITK